VQPFGQLDDCGGVGRRQWPDRKLQSGLQRQELRDDADQPESFFRQTLGDLECTQKLQYRAEKHYEYTHSHQRGSVRSASHNHLLLHQQEVFSVLPIRSQYWTS